MYVYKKQRSDTINQHLKPQGMKLELTQQFKNYILELLQKPQVVFVEEADIGDAEFSHGEAFDAKAEGPAGVFFAVDIYGVENIRVNHSAAAHFDPAFFSRLVSQE